MMPDKLIPIKPIAKCRWRNNEEMQGNMFTDSNIYWYQRSQPFFNAFTKINTGNTKLATKYLKQTSAVYITLQFNGFL